MPTVSWRAGRRLGRTNRLRCGLENARHQVINERTLLVALISARDAKSLGARFRDRVLGLLSQLGAPPAAVEAESRAMNPDYYLVLPWHFKDEFVERERETLNKGIGLIFPLPTIEIVKH